jgi:hypothetical protein
MPFMAATLGGRVGSGLRVVGFVLGVDFFALADFFGEATLVAGFFAVDLAAVFVRITGFLLVVFFALMILSP